MTFKKTLTTGIFLLSCAVSNVAFGSTDFEILPGEGPDGRATKTVDIPAADVFLPMVVNIRAGDTVRFTNNDEDAHTVTSDPAYSSPGFSKIDIPIRPRADHGGPGLIRIRFRHPGIFTYFCQNHAHLDQGQPVNGGIVGPGIVGRPMMGIIIIQ